MSADNGGAAEEDYPDEIGGPKVTDLLHGMIDQAEKAGYIRKRTPEEVDDLRRRAYGDSGGAAPKA